MLQKESEEDSEESGSEDAALFDPAADVEGLGGVAVELQVLCMLLWKDSINLCSLGGQPIFGRILKRPTLLTRSNPLVRSMKATYRGICFSLHFS